MDEDIRKRLEYEEQFYGISSLFFSDCFKKLIKDEVDSKIKILTKNLEKKLLHQAKNPEQFEAALEKLSENLSKEYCDTLDKLYPEIDAKISSLVSVPSNILLMEDLSAKDGINGDLSEIQKEVETLKGTYGSLLYLKQKLMEELQEADSAILCMEYFTKDKKLDFEFPSLLL